MDLVEGLAFLSGFHQKLWIEVRAQLVRFEFNGCEHPLLRFIPVAKCIHLDLNTVPVGIGIVQRHGHSVIQGQKRSDAGVP